MTNIAALLQLFPKKGVVSTTVASGALGTIRGACSYDSMVAALPGAFTSSFVSVIESVRNDARWGPVFHGDLTTYKNDRSAADLALCGEFSRRGLSNESIDLAIRTSALYREKWERDDYRASTLSLARVPPPPAASQTSSWLDPANGFLDASMVSPPPRDWIIDHMFLAGKAAIVAGLSGVSKSQFSLQAGIAIATGTPFMGRGTKPGGVLIISGEDDQDEVRRRVNAYCRLNALAAGTIGLINQRLRAFPAVGENIQLTARVGGQFKPTELDEKIIQLAHTIGDVRMIVLDHVGLMHGGDFAAKEDAAVTMRLVNGIAQRTGAAVMLLAHSPKASAKDAVSDASAIFGSTAFVEQARGGWLLATMREGEAKGLNVKESDRSQYASMVGVKANYAATGDTIWFRRHSFDEVGVLEHVRLQAPLPGRRAADLEGHIIAKIRHAPGQYSKTGLRAFAGLSGPWKASRVSVDGAVETMVGDGRLQVRPPTPAERAQYGHGSQVRYVLDIGAGAPAKKLVK